MLLDQNLKEWQVVPTIFSCGCAVCVCTWIVCRCAHRCRCTQLTSVDGATPWALLVPTSPSAGIRYHSTAQGVFCFLWELRSRFSSLWLLRKHLALWAISPAQGCFFDCIFTTSKPRSVLTPPYQPLPWLLAILWQECSALWEPKHSN